MPMISDPSTKYIPYTEVPFPVGYVRQWPMRRTTKAPTWLSTDLRDGNQALINPMSNKTKLEFFRHLVKIGFKEIEVAYPSASEQEFQFVRTLIEAGEVPDDVTLQVITPAREDLIARSVKSLAGAKNAIIHLYNAVSPVFREVVFRHTQQQTIDLTLKAVRAVKVLTEEEATRSGTHFQLNYCLETFSQTEPEFAVRLANSVLEEWGPTSDKVIFNLAATVECAPSNHYADLVEYFAFHMKDRDNVVLSIHPHNDRGTAVAAAELGMLAGGTRIEGCLLGSGERTGNVDIITLALNLYSQGISPLLDFSDLPSTVSVVSESNETSVPQRYPYAGALVFSAFAGTHQDAIKKGLDHRDRRDSPVWAMPYIPIDPKDLGYGYENLIRVSSQSGKAGTAYIIKQTMDLELPRRLQVSFYNVVQKESERMGKEMTSSLICAAFRRSYGLSSEPGLGRIHLQSFHVYPVSQLQHSPSTSSVSSSSSSSDDNSSHDSSDETENPIHLEAHVIVDGHKRCIRGDGRNPVVALISAIHRDLGVDVEMGETFSQVLKSTGKKVTYTELVFVGAQPTPSGVGSTWGVGISADTTTSKCRALISAANSAIGNKALTKARRSFTPRPSMKERASSWIVDVKLRTGGRNDRHSQIQDVLAASVETTG